MRYFNKETGYEGASYEKKTDGAMCDELGDTKYMQAYVEEQGKTFLCSIADTSNCSAKEVDYIVKWSAKSSEDQTKQLARLEGMGSKKMSPKDSLWINQRSAALKQMIGGGSQADAEL